MSGGWYNRALAAQLGKQLIESLSRLRLFISEARFCQARVFERELKARMNVFKPKTRKKKEAVIGPKEEED